VFLTARALLKADPAPPPGGGEGPAQPRAGSQPAPPPIERPKKNCSPCHGRRKFLTMCRSGNNLQMNFVIVRPHLDTRKSNGRCCASVIFCPLNASESIPAVFLGRLTRAPPRSGGWLIGPSHSIKGPRAGWPPSQGTRPPVPLLFSLLEVRRPRGALKPASQAGAGDGGQLFFLEQKKTVMAGSLNAAVSSPHIAFAVHSVLPVNHHIAATLTPIHQFF